MGVYSLLSRRYLGQRWTRAALIVASIALGVATLVSSQTLNRIIEQAADESTMPMKGLADLCITNGSAPVSKQLADDLRKAKIPGVKSVQPLLFERIVLAGHNDRPAVLLGLDFAAVTDETALPMNVTKLKTLDPLGMAFGTKVFVSKPVFDVNGTEPLKIKLGNREKTFGIAGYYDVPPGSPIAMLGTNVVVLELSAACRFVNPGSPPSVNRIDISLEQQSPESQERIREIVGARGIVGTPDSAGRSTKDIIGGVKIGFTLCSLGALVVGLFLVYNAMSVTVAERRPDIGTLRSLGATRGQIVRLFATLAAILGLVGAALGVPLGLALANFILHEFREVLETVFLNPETIPGTPTLEIVMLAAIAGMGTAVLAALIPAIQAASDPPSDVVRRGRGRIGWFWTWLHRSLCALLILGGVSLILARHSLPHRLGSFGGMMIALVGLLLAAPIFVSIFVALVNPLLRRILPIEARLAADNLTRSPGRTGVVIGALAAGVAVMIQTAGVGRSTEAPITAWLDQMLRADLYIFGGSFVAGTSSQAPMDASVVKDLRQLPGVEMSTGLRFARPEYNDTIIYVIAVDTKEFGDMLSRRNDLPGLRKYHLAQGLRVLASENFLKRHSKNVGDTVSLSGPNGPVNLEIADSVLDYSWSRGTLIMDRSAYATAFGDSPIDFAHVFFRPGEEDTARAAVDAYKARANVTVSERGVMLEAIGGYVTRFYGLAYLQQIVIGVVAALGVVTALLISVLQRRRELGLLLAVGATPAQVIRSVLWEALFMGFFGSLLGFLIGVPLEWYVVGLIFREESGFVVQTLIPWKQAAVIGLGSVLISTLAGVLPAWHAVKTRIPDAIAYE